MIWKCVEFAQESISGLTLLELGGVNSGQPAQLFDWGGGAYTVCQLDREPRQVPERCFGPMSGPNWSDWQRNGAAWTQRATGVGGYAVRDGDLEGWSYSSSFGIPPPAVSFSQVCVPPAAAPAVIAPATPRPAPAGTGSRPAATPSPTPTVEALAPPPSPGIRAAIASDTPPRHPPEPRSPLPLVAFGAMLALLAGLGVWNRAVRRR